MGEEMLVAHGTSEPIGTLPGFGDEAETRLVLTHPLAGWLRRTDGQVAIYSVWDAPLELHRCEVEEARFEGWERVGLVKPGQAPHSVLVKRFTHYLIFLPPRVVRDDGRRARPASCELAR